MNIMTIILILGVQSPYLLLVITMSMFNHFETGNTMECDREFEEVIPRNFEASCSYSYVYTSLSQQSPVIRES